MRPRINHQCPFASNVFVIIFSIILVQTLDSAETKVANKNVINPSEKGMSLDAFLQSKLDKLEEIVSNNNNNHDSINNNKKHFSKNNKRFLDAKKSSQRYRTTRDPTLLQLNQVLSKFLKRNRVHKRNVRGVTAGLLSDDSLLSTVKSINLKRNNDKIKNEAAGKKKDQQQKWENWTEWSSCSVSCGKGRHIRWRHCLENCDQIETEMQEKSCQLPACPQKLFGVIKL